jgi:hypothetical protein
MRKNSQTLEKKVFADVFLKFGKRKACRKEFSTLSRVAGICSRFYIFVYQTTKVSFLI